MRKTLYCIMIMFVFQTFSQEIDTWERRYGDEIKERGKQIIRMNDGTFLINANKIIDDYGFTNLIWLIAVDQNGDSLWTKVIGDSSLNRYINDISPNSTGDLFVASGYDQGGLGQTAFISKKTAGYEEIWTKTYTNMPSLGVGADNVVATSDSGCVVTGGYADSFDSSIGFIEVLDRDGNNIAYKQLENTLHDSIFIPYNRIEALMSRSGMFEEEYVAVGNMQTPDKIYPYIKVFVDSLNIFMENIVSFENLNYLFKGFDVLSNKYVIFGDSKMFDLDRSLRYSSWSTELSPTIHSVKETTDDNFFVGTTSKTYKLNKDGQIIWIKDFGSNSLVLTDDGGCMAIGTKFDDVWICKFDQDGNYVNINNYVGTIDGYELHQNYPNPFNPETEINYSLHQGAQVMLSVLNTKGELVSTLVNGMRQAGNHSAKFNGEGLNSGIYFFRLSVNDKIVASKKMMMLK